MRDAGVEAELGADEVALDLLAGDADDAAAVDAGDLPHDLPDAAARRGDDHRLAGAGPALHHQPRVSGQTEHAEHADRGRDRRHRGVDPAREHVGEDVDAGSGEPVGLPAVGVEEEVAGLEALDAALHHLRHGAAVADVARSLEAAAPPSPLIGIERQVEGPRQHLAVARRWRLHPAPGEVLLAGKPSRRSTGEGPAEAGMFDVMHHQNPRNFHHAKPIVSQISRLTDDTMNPTRHQSPNVT